MLIPVLPTRFKLSKPYFYKWKTEESKEFEELRILSSINSGFQVHIIGSDEGIIEGPATFKYSDTANQDGIFLIDIKIPSDYPYNPPKMKFTTKIWHSSISSQTGAICLDILFKNQWCPTLTIRAIFL
jgi:ubiquitin-protein ligase